MQTELNGRILRLLQGDITQVPVDAICNAANSRLLGGGGVDGAIHAAGGPSLMAELNGIRSRQGGCPTGSAVVTTAGRLPARFVFHAVGPVYRDGRQREPELLASCYRTCLELAESHGVKRISFPSVSTGVYGYPVSAAAPLALQAVRNHLMREKSGLEEVIFVLYDDRTRRAYEDALRDRMANDWR